MYQTKDLVKFAKAGYNVLLRGKHGVGKTALIKEVFSEVFGELDVNWKYFSASTLDPWVDFIGIPKNYTREDGMEVFRIIPPESFTGEEKIQALFFDEINRSDPKTMNALMELIQFKSINGRKFPNLRVVWAAENPAEDGVYTVQPLDPAQKDRFNIQLDIPYELNREYFKSKFDKEIFAVASKWWDKNKDTVSPRKLDDMLDGWQRGFNVGFFSNECGTTRELQHSLESISVIKSAERIAETGTPEAIQTYFNADFIRNNSKVVGTNVSLMGKIYKHVGGEEKAMLENMGYIHIDSDFIEANKDSVDSFSKLWTRAKLPHDYFSDKTVVAAAHRFGNFLKEEKTQVRDKEGFAKFISVMRASAASEESIKHAIFGAPLDKTKIGSGHFSAICHDFIKKKPENLEIYRNHMNFVYIAAWIYRDVDLTNYWITSMQSHNMMAALKRNSVRFKSLKNALDDQVTRGGVAIEFIYGSLEKLYA